MASDEESPEAYSESWNRLRSAMQLQAKGDSAHLEPQELLLHLDEELRPERARHLESCAACHAELLRVQAFLFDIEHELRALMPAEPAERRLAAVRALESRMDAAPKPKVISFPVRWGAVYAAAAALTFAVFGGLWTSQSPAPVVAPEPVAQAPAPIVVPPILTIQAEAAVPARQVTAAPAPAAELDRFALQQADAAPAPQPRSLEGAPEVEIRPAAVQGLDLAWSVPVIPARPASVAPTVPARRASDLADPGLMLAGLRAAARSGAWKMNVEPEVRGSQLTFVGEAASQDERDALIAALRREVKNADVAFEIAVADTPPALEMSRASYTLGDRPSGGLMRSALLAHYGDAARRSFQQPTPSALDSEIARFAGEIYRSQSNLMRHAHALSGVLEGFAGQELSADAARELEGLVRFHADGVAAGEARIYDQLSEALPRRYWNHRGDRQAPQDSSAAQAGEALLADALRLDETLTSLLGSPAGTVNAGDVQTSAGALLFRIRTRARILSSGLDSAR